MPGRSFYRFLLAGLLLLVGLALASGQEQSAVAPLVIEGAVEGAIGPATAHHISRLIDQAEERNAAALILRLNTPGGLTDSTREIISEILTSKVPIIGWVAPPGAHAASAGTYILYATHLAAMAPGTNLGAATPVQLGGFSGPDSGDGDEAGEGGGKGGDGGGGEGGAENGEREAGAKQAPPQGGAMERKVTNDAVAFIRSLAELRARNADWAESAVRDAASLPASEALKKHVIELIAGDLGTLLAKADGRTVAMQSGDIVLHLDGAMVEQVEQGAITRLLGVLSNPNIALILMMVGIYGIIFEFATPGSFGPGIIGVIALAIGLYSLNMLPLDYAGLGLIGLGVIMMVAEAISPSFGALGLGGIAAFVLGSAMLIDTDIPAYQVSWWLIGVVAVISGLVLILLLGVAWRAYRRGPTTSVTMIGARAEVLDWEAGRGHVWAEGERWSARGPVHLGRGEHVQVRALDGLTLLVRRGIADDEERE